MMDRIDTHFEVPRVDYEKLRCDRMGETSESIRQRVQAARNIQLVRFSKIESSNIVANADMRVGEIRQFCKFEEEGIALSLSKCQSLMRAAMSRLNLSVRACHRILNLARTITARIWEKCSPPFLETSKNRISASRFETSMKR